MKLSANEKQVVANIHSLPSVPNKPKRQAGLGKATVWMSQDFYESLPDNFWQGDK